LDFRYATRPGKFLCNLDGERHDLAARTPELDLARRIVLPVHGWDSGRSEQPRDLCQRRRLRGDAGLKILEDIHYDSQKGSGDEEEAWYTATKLLGQLYLEELGKPENALACFTKFKDYHKSGADTLYQIGR
jgi:hypothetical protein